MLPSSPQHYPLESSLRAVGAYTTTTRPIKSNGSIFSEAGIVEFHNTFEQPAVLRLLARKRKGGEAAAGQAIVIVTPRGKSCAFENRQSQYYVRKGAAPDHGPKALRKWVRFLWVSFGRLGVMVVGAPLINIAFCGSRILLCFLSRSTLPRQRVCLYSFPDTLHNLPISQKPFLSPPEMCFFTQAVPA